MCDPFGEGELAVFLHRQELYADDERRVSEIMDGNETIIVKYV
jgi:hypothetical protein